MTVLELILYLLHCAIEHRHCHLCPKLVVNTAALVKTEIKQSAIEDDAKQDAASAKYDERPHPSEDAPNNGNNAE